MRALWLFVMLWLGPCAESHEAAKAGGHFQLVSIDGHALPTVRDSDALAAPAGRPLFCFDSVTVGTLDLAPARDTAPVRYVGREPAADVCGPYRNDWPGVDTGEYFVRGDTLSFRPGSPDGFVRWQGVVIGDTLTAKRDHWRGDYLHGAHSYRYIRVRPSR